MTAIHGFQNYGFPVKEKPAAIPPPPDIPPPIPDPMPPMTSVFEFYGPAFDDIDPPRRWWQFWRR